MSTVPSESKRWFDLSVELFHVFQAKYPTLTDENRHEYVSDLEFFLEMDFDYERAVPSAARLRKEVAKQAADQIATKGSQVKVEWRFVQKLARRRPIVEEPEQQEIDDLAHLVATGASDREVRSLNKLLRLALDEQKLAAGIRADERQRKGGINAHLARVFQTAGFAFPGDYSDAFGVFWIGLMQTRLLGEPVVLGGLEDAYKTGVEHRRKWNAKNERRDQLARLRMGR